MTATRRSTALSTVITVMAMLGMTGCQDKSPTDPTVTGIALKPGGGGGKGPKVESTDPTSAPQETTLDVQVFGSSFDDGSWVTFTIDGTPSNLVQTNTTTFVSDKQLTANITIDLTAIEDLYDVEVLSSGGRKGIGADLFSVTKKGKAVEESNYTITDLGTEGGVVDINDAGVIVGSAGRAARWDLDGAGKYLMTFLGDGGGEEFGSWASAVNASGDAVGVVWIDADFTDRAALWSGGGVDTLPLLDPAHELSQAYGINDAGQISGQSYTSNYDPARAVRWEPDGSVTDLGVLPGYENSIGWAINDLGWVGGSSRPANSEFPAKKQHAVLWIVESDGSIAPPLDLHPVPGIQSIVKGISDVSTDGKVYLAGQLDFNPVVWVFDVETGSIDEQVLTEGGGAEAVNAAGEVVLRNAVWTLATGQVASLPTLRGSCSSSGRGINVDGAVVGSSSVKKKGRCTGHAILWTKNN
ncbi:MAG: hypothetical protein IIA27_07055 [Gemmatimonadetes bacterium]|nr:hypothetical protein [Gemmatimonadota bacterium]